MAQYIYEISYEQLITILTRIKNYIDDNASGGSSGGSTIIQQPIAFWGFDSVAEYEEAADSITAGDVIFLNDDGIISVNYKDRGSTGYTEIFSFELSSEDETVSGYATCNTGFLTAEKEVNINGYTPKVGGIVAVKFVYKIGSGAKLKISPDGGTTYLTARSIFYNGSGVADGVIPAGTIATMMYDGTRYNIIGLKLLNNMSGNGIGVSTNSGSAKTATGVTGFADIAGSIVTIRFSQNAVPAEATLNINSLGAKNIMHNGSRISSGVINAGDTATFLYDGSSYHLIGLLASSASPGGNIDNVVYIPYSTGTTTSITASDIGSELVGLNKKIAYYLVDNTTHVIARLRTMPTSASPESVDFIAEDPENRQYILYSLSSTGAVTMRFVPIASSGSGGTTTLPELGGGYASSDDNDASTVARTATISRYVLTTGNGPTIKFTTAVNASNPTLNISNGSSSTGAKPIWYRGAAVPSGFITAGSLVKFVYDGTNYCIESIDKEFYVKDPGGIPASDLASDAKPLVVHLTSAGGGNFTSDVSETNIIAAAAAGQTVVMVTANGLAYYIGDDGDDDTAFYGFEKSGSGSIWYPARYVVSGTTVTKTIQTYSGSGGIVPTPTAQEAGYVAVAKSDGTVEWKALSSLLTAWTPSNPYGGGN